MKRYKLNIVVVLMLVCCISSCDKSTQKSQVVQSTPYKELTEYSTAEKQVYIKPTSIKQTYPDVRLAFIAQAKPLLDEKSSITVLAARKQLLKPQVVVKEMDFPRSLLFAQDGTLYFIADYDQDAIVELKPSYHSRVVARSGWMADTLRDDGTTAPIYNGFLGLSFTLEGNLLTMRNEAYPFEVNVKTGNQSFIAFKTPDNRLIKTVNDFDNLVSLKSNPDLSSYLQQDYDGHYVVVTTDVIDNKWHLTWYRYQKGQKLEEVKNLLELPPAAYLLMHTKEGSEKWNGETYTLGADGYIYTVETHTEFKDHRADRVIRIGDAGLSSLRKEATRTVIAEFKHGSLTGSLAFNVKGELAVGALNTIYLISSTNTK